MTIYTKLIKLSNDKKKYIARHKANERWDDPYSAGALSRFILWNKPTISASYIFYKNKFKFKSL